MNTTVLNQKISCTKNGFGNDIISHYKFVSHVLRLRPNLQYVERVQQDLLADVKDCDGSMPAQRSSWQSISIMGYRPGSTGSFLSVRTRFLRLNALSRPGYRSEQCGKACRLAGTSRSGGIGANLQGDQPAPRESFR
jgi:hypothetical protein